MGIYSDKKVFFELLNSTFECLAKEDLENVAVVTFFGKSFWDSDGCKYDGFRGLKRKDNIDPAKPHVDGFYNAEQKVIYLQIRGILDVQCLVKAISSSDFKPLDKGYLSMWADLKIAYAQTLYLLSCVSHLMVLCHPVATFDMSYLHLFRALDAARYNKEPMPDYSAALSDAGIHAEGPQNRRLTTPRLIFRFLSSPKHLQDVRQLEHSLEDQIYMLLKKQKLVATNSSSGSSLFSVPANQQFVFVETDVERAGARMVKSVQSIVKQCIQIPATADPINLSRLSILHDLDESSATHKFEAFLKSHIDVVLAKGLDEGTGRQAYKAQCCLPTPKQWMNITKALHTYTVGTESTACAYAIRNCLDIDRKFSEGRCAKVLPLALAAYQENTPPHYPRRYHTTKLAQAMAVLAMHGRGAMLDRYVTILEKQCNEHWRNGRQMCETLSLTGHPCINALHKGGGDGAGGGELREEKEEKARSRDTSEERKTEGLEDKEHCSGMRYMSACNCGRKQGQRVDPYTLKAANFEFYRSLATECGCDKLESFKLPVFQPSVKDFRAAQLLGRRESLALLRADAPRSQLLGGTQQDPFSLAFVSGSVQGSCDAVETRLSCLRTQHPDILILTNQPSEAPKDKSLVRQASTTEYLPGMLHTESPAGLLPQFASWSLICVGASSVYSHNLGLTDQTGLLNGSSYLLPWDVTVRLDQKKNVWPAVTDTKRTGSQLRLRKNKGEQSEMVVKIFVGVEYECTRGHRFMGAGPDKVLKTGPSGQVRDTGHKVASSDMPLYFPCPCSKPNKPVVGQLMRLHVVTPKAPVRVTLNPRVQPAPNAPIFIACQDQPIPLTQSTYWVLRLPYVYMAERAPFVAPMEISGSPYGKLFGGSFGIAEIPPDRVNLQ